MTPAVIEEARRRQRRRRLTIGAVLAAALVVALLLALLGPSNGSSPLGTGASRARRHAAPPVPGVFYSEETGKPPVVCVGRGGWIARTPTKQDLERFERRYEQTHTLPRLPATLSLHALPNGKVAGTCNYGPGPRTVADNL